MATTVRPPIKRSRASRTASSDSLSSAEVASSSRRMGASLRNARAMPMRCRCPRDLACNPFRGRMRCDVDPNKVSAGQPDDDQAVEQIKSNGWNNEQVHGGDVRCVVTQEGAPPLGRRSTSLDHVFRHARLSDLEAELEQLA